VSLYDALQKQLIRRCITSRFKAGKLVYYETCSNALGAIAREKQIKAGSRHKKISLVNRMNPDWRDLYDDL